MKSDIQPSPAPANLATVPKSWQMIGKEKLIMLRDSPFRGGFLADDPGLGKTYTAILGALQSRKETGGGFILVVCPKSRTHQWADELIKHFKPVSK